jgi:hypothetical protein
MNNKLELKHYVAVEKGKEYKGGVGYTGPILKELGFPIGPWSPAGAKTFVRQAKDVDYKKEFVIHEWIEG